MHISTLYFVIAVVALLVIFGPKPRRRQQNTTVPTPGTIKMPKERAMARPMQPLAIEEMRVANGASRAPSPLQLRDPIEPLPPINPKTQYAEGGREGSLLPHEMPRY